MHQSVVLRLLPAERAGSRLAGVLEVVDTGEQTTFRDADDLVAALEHLRDRAPVGSGAHRPGIAAGGRRRRRVRADDGPGTAT